jgi:two-component system sensor histidine kinase KdpD
VKLSSWKQVVRLLASAGIIVAIAMVFAFVAKANATTISLTFLLAILGMAAVWGLAEALLASILAMASFNYFFLPPIGTLTISDPHNWVALIAFLITAITASQLSISAKRRAAEAEGRRKEVELLYALGQAILQNDSLRFAAADIVKQFVKIFEVPAAAFFSAAENEYIRSDDRALSIGDERLIRAAHDREPMIDRENKICIVPIRLGERTIGSLGMIGRILSPAALNAVANLVAVGIERARALEEASRIEAARQSEVLKSALIDALAHDLKTPLTSIKGVLTHLLGKAQDAEGKELLSLANEETDRLHRLVGEVLEMAQIEAGELDPQLHSEAIGEIVCAAARELEEPMKARDIRISIPHELPLVRVDFDFIQKAIKQVLDNACRYSPPDSAIEVDAVEKDGSLIVRIADHGPGIAIEEQLRVFDKFFRGSPSRYQVPGTGLGLSIAKGIIEAHGGKIWVASSMNAGSVFHISLPLGERRL